MSMSIPDQPRRNNETPSNHHETHPAQPNQRVERIFHWLPDECRSDHVFVSFMNAVVVQHNPRTAYEEVTVARMLEALWRLRASLTKPNADAVADAAAARARAQAEQNLARAEISWLRLRRAGLAEQKQRQLANATRANSNAANRPAPQARNGRAHPQGTNGTTPKPAPTRAVTAAPPDVPTDQPIDWRDYIELNPSDYRDGPVLKGIGVPVEYVASAFAENGNDDQILAENPFLNRTQLRAVRQFEEACAQLGRTTTNNHCKLLFSPTASQS